MGEAIYDDHAKFYVDFVDRISMTAAYEVSVSALLDALGDIRHKDVCDLACGEGFLSRIMAARGAQVRGFDLSERLIEVARARSNNEVRFDIADAQRLEGIEDNRFDIVVCHLAAMDIPDLNAMFATVRRVLRPSGKFVACRVMHYKQEGLWHSGGIGVRGRVGAYHRMLSTYLNGLVANGFELTRFLEPILPDEEYSDFADQWSRQIPRRLGIIARARG